MSENERFVPELDRWFVWMITKSWDMPRHKVLELLRKFEITVYEEGDSPSKWYISKTEWKEFLYSID